MGRIQLEYIWLDGNIPTAHIRSKTKIIDAEELKLKVPQPTGKQVDIPPETIERLPKWGFDGSSTGQAEGADSDCGLVPVHAVLDPLRPGGKNLLVLCEVTNIHTGKPHPTNTRVHLRNAVEKYGKKFDPWFGVEQEYTLYHGPTLQHSQLSVADGFPLAWTLDGKEPKTPQGVYYCSVGAGKILGRKVVEEHTAAAISAGLAITGTNSEVMPGQWEFQAGKETPLRVADDLILARWLLQRVAEDHNVAVSFEPKPIKGDWNGAGAHTNLSTKQMRSEGGIKHIEEASKKLTTPKNHENHIAVYGAENHERLTGRHETASIDKSFWGVGHRGASIRVNSGVARAGKGYLEDRRPAANMNPYLVLTAILETACGDGFDPEKVDPLQLYRRTTTPGLYSERAKAAPAPAK